MKTKSRLNVWLCCSVLEVKGKKEKKKRCDQTAENILSKIFVQQSNSRITTCICCSVIEESLPPLADNTDSSHDMEKELSKGPITVTGIPTIK